MEQPNKKTNLWIGIGAVFVTLAVVGATFQHNDNHSAASNSADLDLAATAQIAKSKEHLYKGEHVEAINLLRETSAGTPEKKAEVQTLLNYAENFSFESTRTKTIMALKQAEFSALLDGKKVNLNPDPQLNDRLNELLKKTAPTVKKEYFARIKQAELAAKHKQEQAAKAAKIAAQFGTEPQQSAWDGSYRSVEQFLKKAAHDPDSVKIEGCTKVSIDDKAGWVVGCEYRGKNAFGALVKSSNWFIIRHDKVIDMVPADRYSAH